MPYLAGDEGWVGSMPTPKTRRLSFPVGVPRPSPDITARQLSTRHTTSPSSASIEQISIAHRCVNLPQSKGFGHSHSPKFDRPPAPFSSPTSQLARTFVDRCTDTAHHVAFSSLAPREVALFSFCLWFKTSKLSPSKDSWVVIEGGGATAPSQQVLCADPNHLHLHHHTGSRWISSHWEEQSTKFSAPSLILAENERSPTKFTAGRRWSSALVPFSTPGKFSMSLGSVIGLHMHPMLFLFPCTLFSLSSASVEEVWEGAWEGAWEGCGCRGVGAGQVSLREAGWPQTRHIPPAQHPPSLHPTMQPPRYLLRCKPPPQKVLRTLVCISP